jgi:hypothetical protein
MRQKVLIGVHGKPRAGKDTIAARLVQKHNLLRYGPSVPVKTTTAAMFNFPVENLYDDSKKDTVDPFWNISYREMAQKVGKESSRDIFGEDFWMRHVDLMWQKILTEEVYYEGMVLADIRYPNEVAWVKKHGGLVVFVTRENRNYVANETHAAERGLDEALADVIIPNNGTIEELWEKIDYVVEPLWM